MSRTSSNKRRVYICSRCKKEIVTWQRVRVKRCTFCLGRDKIKRKE